MSKRKSNNQVKAMIESLTPDNVSYYSLIGTCETPFKKTPNSYTLRYIGRPISLLVALSIKANETK